MVGVGDQPRHHPQHSEWLNLQVGCVCCALVLVQSHDSVALLIDIQVLHQALLQEVVEAPLPLLHSAYVCVRDPRDPLVTDDQGPADPAAKLHSEHQMLDRCNISDPGNPLQQNLTLIFSAEQVHVMFLSLLTLFTPKHGCSERCSK